MTEGACHLDARMMTLPSSYDLGEAAKIVLLSMIEGEDRPLKYHGIFHRASLMLLTKTDLLPDVEFDPQLALENARKIHPEMEYTALSSPAREGFPEWLNWLQGLQQKVQAGAAATISQAVASGYACDPPAIAENPDGNPCCSAPACRSKDRAATQPGVSYKSIYE